MTFAAPYLGHGIGLRSQHYNAFLKGGVKVPWCEAISENFLMPGGRPLAVLERVRREHPVVLHGVSLSIGATDPLNLNYLHKLKDLAEHVQPAWVSDHLCWGSQNGRYAHDLLPMPYTEEALQHVVSRVRQVQDTLKRQIMLENVSSYVEFTASTMPEWEFFAAVAEQADCGILLDVNNVFVSAHNHGYDPHTYIHGIPAARVGQLHLAGHTDKDSFLLDTHVGPVPASVWQLYRATLNHVGRVSTLVEWDEEVPDLEVVLAEAAQAQALADEVLGTEPSNLHVA